MIHTLYYHFIDGDDRCRQEQPESDKNIETLIVQILCNHVKDEQLRLLNRFRNELRFLVFAEHSGYITAKSLENYTRLYDHITKEINGVRYDPERKFTISKD